MSTKDSYKNIAEAIIIVLCTIAILYTIFPYCLPLEPPENIPQEKKSTINRIHKRDKLLVGVYGDTPPFGFIKNENNQVDGFDIDLIKAIAKKLNIEVEFIIIKSKERIDVLRDRKVDIVAAALTHTKARDEEIDFSQTYFLDGQSLLVQKNSSINSLIDITDATRIAVLEGTTSKENIYKKLQDNNINAKLCPFNDRLQAVKALVDNEVDVFTSDKGMLSYFASQYHSLKLINETLSMEPYGFGLPSNDSSFRGRIDFALQELKKDGIYDKIYKKWFKGQVPYEVETFQGSYRIDNNDISLHERESLVDKILKEGRFTAAIRSDFKPFSFYENDRVGFDVDIMHEFAKRWTGRKDAVKFKLVTAKKRIEILNKEEVDIVAAAMTHTNDRDIDIDFSQTYFIDGQRLLVRKDSNINDFNGLNNKKVAVVSGATSHENIQTEADKNGILIDILEYRDNEEAVDALKNNTVDAFTTDEMALLEFVEADSNLKITGDPFSREPYGIGVRNNDSRFRDLINFTLQEMKFDGTYDAIYCRWFKNKTPYNIEITPGMPTDPVIKNRITTSSPQTPDCIKKSVFKEEFFKYIVKKGDTLSKLANRYYGDTLRWDMICEDNKNVIDDCNKINLNQVLTIRRELPGSNLD